MLALDFRGSRLDAPLHLGLLALDSLHHLALAPGQSLDNVLDGAPALVGELLERVLVAGQSLLDRTRHLFAQAGDQGSLLLALGGDALAVGLDAGPRFLDHSLYAANELADLARNRGLAVPEVALPALDSFLDVALSLGKHLGELLFQGLLGFGDRVPSRLGQGSLLLGKLRRGIGASTRQNPFELSDPRPDLAVDLRPEHRSASFQLTLDLARPLESDCHCDRSQRSGERGGRHSGADREIAPWPEHDRDPAGRGEDAGQNGYGDRDASRRAAERRKQ